MKIRITPLNNSIENNKLERFKIYNEHNHVMFTGNILECESYVRLLERDKQLIVKVEYFTEDED